MDLYKEKIKKLYDETASLIVRLSFEGKLSSEEMRFLLNLLDFVILKRGNFEIVSTLKKWISKYDGSETDEIIKATLLAVDFNNSDSIRFNMELIRELLEVKG
ncbi:MAG: hypothetical protein H5T98_02225 [Syntrophomonadaceae bacterium]|nr:hypothetical protein [Syntrophomonadaceae bacterium]